MLLKLTSKAINPIPATAIAFTRRNKNDVEYIAKVFYSQSFKRYLCKKPSQQFVVRTFCPLCGSSFLSSSLTINCFSFDAKKMQRQSQ